MKQREQRSSPETDDDPFADGARFHWSWHGALVVTLGVLAITLVLKIDLPRVASPSVHKANATDHRIDLNTATLTELEALPNIGPVKAKRIVGCRPFQSVNDLLRVPGLGSKVFERLLPHVKVSVGAPTSN